MQLIISVLILFILINCVLKLSFWRIWQAALFGAVCGAFVIATYPYAILQSKTQLADYLQNTTALQNMAVIITLESVVCFAYCIAVLRGWFGQQERWWVKPLKWYPSLLVFPVLFYLQTELVFSFPGTSFSAISYAFAAAVVVLFPLLCHLFRLLLPEKEMRTIRGGKMSMIFQEPMSSLNPAMRIDKQMIEGIRLHTDLTKEQARERAAKILQQVGIPDPERVLKNYPHQLSGGMSQRVMIAMAMSCNPELLIADEPTALDVTIQAQILDLMKKIQQEEGMSILLITHDLGVVAEMCSRVIVMYAGEIVEEAPVDILFNHPSHPYTIGLIASVPKLGSGVKVLPSIPGSVPDLSMLPKGCRFAPRCKYATERCHNEEPSLFEVSPQQKCRCWLAEPAGKEDK